ncbi:triose-phosphate transporter family-domain-containing protein [Pisolithus orientalis]|uniref:triose-phosphate transporter family-domain-containing protein n=1 Tax=Pisolithus orientalis TaxID=936130 RepID=UPI002224C373|nr:triose-phosphate transporter family-domain-containing protein [Pisolithus orientalis]KAI5999422.1 triose-phosphate transporter family-domain-containing protein [Pisolithus orientalis]
MQQDGLLGRARGEYNYAHLDIRDAWRHDPPDKSWQGSSTLAILTNIKKYVLRRTPAASQSFQFLPSFNRRTRGALRVHTESTPFETARFVFLCVIWYTTSALSSNTGKAILIQFRYPVSLTIIQFAFVAAYCLMFMSPLIQFSRLRYPTRSILMTTLPMGAFQVGGHMFSSMAISRIPVSTVHTIKALSPLFTVGAYAMLFGVKYSIKTYISLLPLIVGVMLAFTFDVSASSPTGLFCAFGSALVFVSQNIFFKKVMPSGSQTTPDKLDKLNLLLYSSSMAFILMVPIWSFTDLPRLLSTQYNSHPNPFSFSLVCHFVMNGSVNFAQNITAFVILSSTSPVTYSIASLIKRVWVICMAIVWFNQSIHPIQGFGIALTFVGLWMYNASKSDVEKGEKTMRRVEAIRNMVLPSTRADEKLLNGSVPSSPRLRVAETNSSTVATGLARVQYTAGVPQDGYSQSRGLHIDISSPDLFPAFSKRTTVISPTGPYPSPPLSVDSPSVQLETFDYNSSPSHLVNLPYSSMRVEQVSA